MITAANIHQVESRWRLPSGDSAHVRDDARGARSRAHVAGAARYGVREDPSPLAAAKGLDTTIGFTEPRASILGLSRPRTADSLGLRLW